MKCVPTAEVKVLSLYSNDMHVSLLFKLSRYLLLSVFFTFNEVKAFIFLQLSRIVTNRIISHMLVFLLCAELFIIVVWPRMEPLEC